MANDPAFAEHIRRMRNAISFAYRQRLKQNPDAYNAVRLKAKVQNKAWREAISLDPERALERKMKRRQYYVLVWKPKHQK